MRAEPARQHEGRVGGSTSRMLTLRVALANQGELLRTLVGAPRHHPERLWRGGSARTLTRERGQLRRAGGVRRRRSQRRRRRTPRRRRDGGEETKARWSCCMRGRPGDGTARRRLLSAEDKQCECLITFAPNL